MNFKTASQLLVCLFVILVLCCAVGKIATAQSIMQPGAWQMKTTITAKNPATGETIQGGESTIMACLSKEFLAKQPYFTPGIDEEKMRLKGLEYLTSDYVLTGNTASWKMACVRTDGSKVDMTIKNVADTQSLTTALHQVVIQGADTALVDIVMASSFVGECTSDMLRP